MEIIGITGGKGGTGKSTIATALAFNLSQKDLKVLLVDADVDCPNDHLLLSMERNLFDKVEQRIPKWDLKKCTKCGLCGTVCKTKAIVSVEGRNPIFTKQQCNGCGACYLKCPSGAISWDKKEVGKIYRGEKSGLDLLSGELNSNEPVSEIIVGRLKDLVEKMRKDYDFVVVDTAAGIHCPVVSALEICDRIIAVAEPTPLGVHDLNLILELSGKLKVRTDVVINFADIGNKKSVINLVGEKHFSVIAEISYSQDIVLQYSAGRPIVNKEIDDLAEQLRVG